jgi:hypothetical protein
MGFGDIFDLLKGNHLWGKKSDMKFDNLKGKL